MKALVIFDSQFGNTEKIARAIGEGLAKTAQTEVKYIDDVTGEDLTRVDVLIAGSPTQRFSATPKVSDFLKSLPSNSLKGVSVSAFDTRFTEAKIGEIKILEFFVNIFGYAANPIAKRLKRKGGTLIADPQGFYVADTEGPLLDEELARARSWAEQISRSVT